MVEEDGTDIVQMPVQGEQTSSGLIRPHFDLVIVSARHEEGLGPVKVDATDWPIMLLKSVNERSHAVVP